MEVGVIAAKIVTHVLLSANRNHANELGVFHHFVSEYYFSNGWGEDFFGHAVIAEKALAPLVDFLASTAGLSGISTQVLGEVVTKDEAKEGESPMGVALVVSSISK